MVTHLNAFNHRRLGTSALVIAVCLILVACAPAATPAPPIPATAPATIAPAIAAATKAPAAFDWKKFAGKQVNVIMSEGPQMGEIKKRVPEFEALTGIKVQLDLYSVTELYAKELLALTTTPDRVDVFMFVPPQQMIKFLKEGFLEDLYPYMKNSTMTSPAFDEKDWIPATLKRVEVSGKLTGIPLYLHTDFLYYRKDLYQEKGLKCPETLQDLEKNIIATHQPDKDIYGWSTRGIGSQSVPYAGMMLWNYGGSFLNDKGEPALNTPEAIAAFQLYGDWLRKYGPPGPTDLDDGRAVNLFKEGKTAHLLLNVFQGGAMNDPATSKVSGKVGACPWPKGPKGAFYNNIVVTLSINPKSPNKETAWYFVQWATGKEIMAICMGTPSIGSLSGRQSAWDSPLFKNGAAAAMPDWAAVAALAVASPGTSNYPPAEDVAASRDVVGAIVTTAIKGGDVAAAANDANVKYKKLLEGAK